MITTKDELIKKRGEIVYERAFSLPSRKYVVWYSMSNLKEL